MTSFACGVLVALLATGGCASDLGPGRPPRSHVIWELPIRSWTVTPALSGETVYFASRAHDVIAVDRATGRERWRSTTGVPGDYPIGANLVVAGDVVVMPDILLFAFDTATGTPRWTFRPANRDQPGLSGIATDGETIYTPSIDNHAYAVDARTGRQKWDTTLPGDSTSGSFNPAVRDGLVFIGVKRFRNPTTGAFVALDAATGAIRWTHEFQPGYPGALTGCLGRSAFDGPNVIVAAEDGQIYAFDRQTGAVRWTAPRVHPIPSEDPGGA